MKKRYLVVIIILVVIAVIALIYKPQAKVCFENNCFKVELAKTPQERERGLMFRQKLDLDKGMLFIFEEEGDYPFWMKDTLIPLDIIWLNKNKEIVFMTKNTEPCKADLCPAINPETKAQYILELNGGVADRINIKLGDKFVFYNI